MVKIDVRKLISFGKNSHIISLPKNWVDRNNLKKGDLISIHESKDGLLIKTNSDEIKEEAKTATINTENKSIALLKTEIIAAYLDNYNKIEVISNNIMTNGPEIRKILRDLSGLEIINQSSKRIVAKDLIDINEIQISTLIRRMDNITRSMIEDSFECFEGTDHSTNMSHIDEEVNRLHFLTYRIIRNGLKNIRVANSLETDNLKLHLDHSITRNIERVADCTKRICRNLKNTKLDQTGRDNLKQVFTKIKQSYLDVMKAYYTDDKDIALGIEERNKDLITSCTNFFQKHNHKDLKYGNGSKPGVCNFRGACGATSRIIENMKEMSSSVKHIARAIIGG